MRVGVKVGGRYFAVAQTEAPGKFIQPPATQETPAVVGVERLKLGYDNA